MAVAVAKERRTKALGSERVREALVGYGFVALPMAFFLLFFIFPIGYAFYISRYDWGIFKGEYVGWDKYTVMFGVAVLFAIPFLWSVSTSLRPTAETVSGFSLLPHTWTTIGYHHGNAWFTQQSTALPSIMGLNGWTTSGTMMLFYLASLQAIPTEVYEAAAIDGAGPWRTFWKVTFPLLKPGHFFVAVVSVIGALQLFDQAFIIGGASGGPNYSTLTVVLYLYNRAFSGVQFGYAGAVGLVLFAFIFVVTLVQRLLFGKAEVA